MERIVVMITSKRRSLRNRPITPHSEHMMGGWNFGQWGGRSMSCAELVYFFSVGRSASTVTKGGVSHLRAALVGTVRPTYVSPLSRAAPVGTASPSPVSPLANLPSLSSTGVTTSTGMKSHRKVWMVL